MSDKPALATVTKKYSGLLCAWFAGLEPRDKKSLSILLTFLSVLLLWLLVWQPVENARTNAQESYLVAHNALEWIKSHAKEAKSATYSSKEQRPLLTIANDTAQKYQLKFNQAEPGDNNNLHITLENASFNNVMRWINAMATEHGIQTTKVAIKKQEASGMVNATVTFKSP